MPGHGQTDRHSITTVFQLAHNMITRDICGTQFIDKIYALYKSTTKINKETREGSDSLQKFQVASLLLAANWAVISKAGDTLSSRHVSSRDVTCAVRIFNIEFWGRLTLLSTLLTSRDLTYISGRLTCQHVSQISVVAHISWDVTYVSSALQTLLPVVSRNGGNVYWKNAPTDIFIWHQVTRLLRSAYESQCMGRNREGVENKT
jgi:hypothetical protein